MCPLSPRTWDFRVRFHEVPVNKFRLLVPRLGAAFDVVDLRPSSARDVADHSAAALFARNFMSTPLTILTTPDQAVGPRLRPILPTLDRQGAVQVTTTSCGSSEIRNSTFAPDGMGVA